MELILLLFLSQIVVYSVFFILKKRLNRWISLGYTILDVLLTIPIGFIILLLGAMGTDSGTDEAIRASTIFMFVSTGITLAILLNSLIYTIYSFNAHGKQKQKEVENDKVES